MVLGRGVRIALLGVGTIGRELARRTIPSPHYHYVAVADTSGVIVNVGAFGRKEMAEIVGLKGMGGRLKDYKGRHDYYEGMASVFGCCDIDVLIDVTDAQTYSILMEALDYTHVLVSNKIPIADASYSKFQRLVSKSREERRILDFGTTVGAGLKIPNLIRTLGVDGIERVRGCLSGTMNYVSQRMNEDTPMSVAVKEAMEPPRCYTEPDPRVDLGGEDFARKLVIVGRVCGRRVERSMIGVEDIVPDELKALSVDEFLEALPTLDPDMMLRSEKARRDGKAMWYLGTSDLEHDEYRVGFEEVPLGDPITKARESDNVLKIFPKLWRRPVTIIGPGAGAPETVTGLIAGLSSVSDVVG
ncbi:MAG: hypothetical protein ACE5Z5_01600 [Candidatus Bathyarchaeia archaeon]